MQNSVNQRVKIIWEDSGLGKSGFASKIKKSRTALDYILNGDREPQDQTINDICEAFGANPTWVRTGKGEKYLNGQILSPSTEKGTDSQLVQSLKDYIKFLENDLNVWRETARNLSAHLGKPNPIGEPAMYSIAPIEAAA